MLYGWIGGVSCARVTVGPSIHTPPSAQRRPPTSYERGMEWICLQTGVDMFSLVS